MSAPAAHATLATLSRHKCAPLPRGAKPLSRAEIKRLLAPLPGWLFKGGVIAKTYGFGNYHETMAFVNAAAFVAHREDHHPDMAVSYNKCRVAFSTHSIGGISMNDFICAARIELLAKM
jgi:4a-hydroxytetrahydrobiopterin dehydratase